MRTKWRWAFAPLLVAGCGIEALESSTADKQAAAAPAAEAPAAEFVGGQEQEGRFFAVERKIIYSASVQLVVQDLSATNVSVPRLVEEFQGYLAETHVAGVQGRYPMGRWVARIPSDDFASFLDAVSELGTPVSRSQQAEDVTEEYVDLEARIANAKKLESRLLTFADETARNVKEILEIEKELSRVRGEIERMEGRLKFLTNRTSFSTVSIEARQEKDYEPPRAPSYSDRVQRVWTNSTESLKEVGENLTLAGVAAVPWLPVIGIASLPFVWAFRRIRRWWSGRS